MRESYAAEAAAGATAEDTTGHTTKVGVKNDDPRYYVCIIKNKFYENNTGIATDEQIAQNPIILEHKYAQDAQVVSKGKNGHIRRCLSGHLVTEPHNLNGYLCTVCGRDTKNDQEPGGGETPPTDPKPIRK